MEFTSFDTACQHIEQFTNLEKSVNYTVRTYRLDRMYALLEHFSRPQDDFMSIHVAGSKGKGSTACYIAQGLKALGHRTGLYSSPHVATYRERFTLAGMFFDDHFLLSTANDMITGLEDFHFQEEYGYSEPTTFELLTLLGFLLFSRSGCEYAVIETGLGGRLDATNVILPIISVITPIELEHTNVLGDTIELIATEKAGIIKQTVPVVMGLQRFEQTRRVISGRAEERGSELICLEDELIELKSMTTSIGEEALLSWTDGSKDDLILTMRGSFQAENAALALLVLKRIGCFDRALTIPAVARAQIPGRLELLRENPSIYIDGAHTENSLQRVLSAFRALHPTGGVLLFGAVEGKNHERMAKIALEFFDSVIISTPGSFKKSDPKALYELFLSTREHLGQKNLILLEEDATLALDKAVELASDQGNVILTAGSFYLASEIRKRILSPITSGEGA